MNNLPVNVLAAVRDLSSALPSHQKLETIKELVSQIIDNAGDFSKLPEVTRSSLLALLPLPIERGPSQRIARAAFIFEHRISNFCESQVEVNPIRDTTILDFLKKAQNLSIKLHLWRPESFRRPQAISPACLEIWESDSKWSYVMKKNHPVRVDGNVKSSVYYTGLEQEIKGWNDVTLQELAVAHVAFSILTGKDLFNGHAVRAAGGTLTCGKDGLSVCDDSDILRDHNVAASSYIT